MNIAEFSIRKNIITWTMTVVLLVLGFFSYRNLSRLEDPEFAIKDAVVITPYPGASPGEVEEEVSEVIEKAVQELGQLERVESYSSRGLSTVRVKIKDRFDKNALPQIWDEMRRKVTDHQSGLPSGAGPSIVRDDFGDVYGVYFALTGEGYTFAEMKNVAEMLKRELLTVKDVKKVAFFGVQQEAIYVEMSRSKMANLGITQMEIYDALQAKNLPADSGKIKIGPEYMAIYPSGTFQSEKDFGDLLVSSRGGKLIYLGDVAEIRRDYVDPPGNLLRSNGKPAIGVAISTVSGGNVVVMGEGIKKRIKELMPQIPLGMDLHVISLQSESVVNAIQGFVVNLVEAVIIVIVVLLVFMGLTSGLIIGFILVLTIAATFVVMNFYQIALERVSLGALIIALGMLVDNAIVVVDGMKVKLETGTKGLDAARDVVARNAVPLLGATAVAVLAFASIGGMENSTGEFCRSLYYVILISLSLSWLTAVTTTPLMSQTFLKVKTGTTQNAEPADPYGGKFYQFYRKTLTAAIRFRWVTIAVVVGMFLLAMIGFKFVDRLFFPASIRPQFMVECQFREGTHIRETEKKVARIEEYLRKYEAVTDIASAIGAGHSRFVLTYDVPVDASSHYSSILVSVNDYKRIEDIYYQAQDELDLMFPDATINVKKFNLGPGAGGKIQLRINGSDPSELRYLAEEVKEIMAHDPDVKAVRDEWGAKVKLVRPVLAEDRARQLGLSRVMVTDEIKANFSGKTTGLYREGIELIPIIARAPERERLTLENLRGLQIFSPTAQRQIPILQVMNDLETVMEDARISRWHRRSMIKLHCDARRGLSSEVFARIKPKIEQALGADVAQYTGKKQPEGAVYTAETIPVKYDDIIPLKGKPGYFLAWGGEAEDSANSDANLAGAIPLFFGMMILVVIFLFNAFRQPLIIWLTVPLSLIGVTAGLLVFHQPFGFMALLGLMSLSGMLIKNAIVLIDQIDLEIREGKQPFHAIVDSGVSRMRPVAMAALTTIMGMIPLLKDDFFVSMAVTIMFGLGFATLLTLVVVPVLYAVFFKVVDVS